MTCVGLFRVNLLDPFRTSLQAIKVWTEYICVPTMIIRLLTDFPQKYCEHSLRAIRVMPIYFTYIFHTIIYDKEIIMIILSYGSRIHYMPTALVCAKKILIFLGLSVLESYE